MERGRIAKPKESADEGGPSEYYLAGDLWVGGRVDFNSHRFVLIDSDEYALRYMEARPSLVGSVLDTIRESVDSLCRDDADMPMPPYIRKACNRPNAAFVSLFR